MTALVFVKAEQPYPRAGQRIEFLNDRFTDKGPASGTIEECKATVDGYYVKVKISDWQATLSWDDLRGSATKDGDLWTIKAHPLLYPGPKSKAQAEAGNYKKRKFSFQGIWIRVENEPGTIRRGKDPSGKDWAIWMLYPYGYVMRSEGVDGDEVDVFIGPNMEAPMVYIIRVNKYRDWKEYDEDKCFLGFDSADDARAAFSMHYTDPRFLREIVPMSIEEFKIKVKATYEEPGMIKGLILFLKAHVGGYTKKDGTAVAPHEDKRPAHRGFQRGDIVKYSKPSDGEHGFRFHVHQSDHDADPPRVTIRDASGEDPIPGMEVIAPDEVEHANEPPKVGADQKDYMHEIEIQPGQEFRGKKYLEHTRMMASDNLAAHAVSNGVGKYTGRISKDANVDHYGRQEDAARDDAERKARRKASGAKGGWHTRPQSAAQKEASAKRAEGREIKDFSKAVPVLFISKAHVGDYTKKDGTHVNAHEDNRPIDAKPHSSGIKVGHDAMFPHPDKPGKKALGKYAGHRDGKSVIKHGSKEHEVDHDKVEAPSGRGFPKQASAHPDTDEYDRRVSAHEKNGMTRSDAQGTVDAEDMKKQRKS